MKFSLAGILPGRKKRSTGKTGKSGRAPQRSDVLSLRPVRNPAIQWKELDGQVSLKILREKTRASGWKARLAGVLVNIPESRTVELDAIGTDVWLMLDGINTIDTIIKALVKKHKISRRETELSLQEYFKELNRRGYIAFVTEKQNSTKDATPDGAAT
jgi:hypothetical protein